MSDFGTATSENRSFAGLAFSKALGRKTTRACDKIIYFGTSSYTFGEGLKRAQPGTVCRKSVKEKL